MKKVAVIMLAIFVVAAFSTAFAQDKTAKGQIELGGRVSFIMTSEKFDGEKFWSGSEFVVYPSVGYFIIPKLELEPTLLIAYSSGKYEGEGEETSSRSDFGGLLNVAYHFERATPSDLIPFVFLGVGMVSHSGKNNGETVEDLKTTMILPDAGVGIKYFLTDKGAVRAELFYQRLDKAYGIDKYVQTNIGLRAGISIFLK